MDYQQMNQPMGDDMNQSSSNVMWYIVPAAIIIAGLAFWFYSSRATPTPAENTAVDQSQTTGLSSGNSISDILTDLNQTADDSAALNQAAAASSQDVQSF